MLAAGIDKVHRDMILGHSLKGMDVYYISPDDDTLKAEMKKYSKWFEDQISILDQTLDQLAVNNT
jgi:hypothetical protein